jgi:hypothetical protein
LERLWREAFLCTAHGGGLAGANRRWACWPRQNKVSARRRQTLLALAGDLEPSRTANTARFCGQTLGCLFTAHLKPAGAITLRLCRLSPRFATLEQHRDLVRALLPAGVQASFYLAA